MSNMNELIKDLRFLGLSVEKSKKSEDYRTQIGSMVSDKNGKVVGIGTNRFPKGTSQEDIKRFNDDRNLLYPRIIHAEVEAVTKAGKMAVGGTVYASAMPCLGCAKKIVESGIKKVVYKISTDQALIGRWTTSWNEAKALLQENGILVIGLYI